MTRTLINFATPEYGAKRKQLSASGKPYFDEIIEYYPRDIDINFRTKHAKHFEYRRGFGFWIWKPYLILRELEAMANGDELWYADSQCVFQSDPKPVFDIIRRHDGIGIFHQRREGHKNKTWVRGDTFALMCCNEPKYWEGDNLAATYSCWIKTEKSVAFVRKWLEWCCNFDVIADGPSTITPDRPEFKDNRQDQSVLSLLAIKENVFTLCACSEWGDGYRCSECNYPRILYINRSVIAPWLRTPRMSRIVEVTTTDTCALKCDYCPQDKLESAYQGPKALTLEMFRRCLDNMIPGDAIHFSGFVEPCLNPDILPLMELAIDRGHCVSLYTTGRGLDRAKAEKIAKMPLDKFVLHLPDAAGHLGHVKGNTAILDILAGHPRAQCMAMDHTPHKDVAHIWERLKQNRGAMHDRAGNVTTSLPVVSVRHKGPIQCSATAQLDHPVLIPDGRLALCCCDYSLNHIVGDLSTTPLSEIMRGPAIAAIVEKQRNGGDVICRSCSIAKSI
jgi:hypothetical protein